MIVDIDIGNTRAKYRLIREGAAGEAASTLACTPSALSQSKSRPLGAQAGPSRLIAALESGGFRTARVATTTPFNLVLEARP